MINCARIFKSERSCHAIFFLFKGVSQVKCEMWGPTPFTHLPTGTLEYVCAGVSQGVFTEAPAGFSKDAFLNLTYTIDPTSKKLLRLEFGGSDHSDAFHAKFPTDFTISDIAGFLGSTAKSTSAFGRVDNFVIAIGDE